MTAITEEEWDEWLEFHSDLPREFLLKIINYFNTPIEEFPDREHHKPYHLLEFFSPEYKNKRLIELTFSSKTSDAVIKSMLGFYVICPDLWYKDLNRKQVILFQLSFEKNILFKIHRCNNTTIVKHFGGEKRMTYEVLLIKPMQLKDLTYQLVIPPDHPADSDIADGTIGDIMYDLCRAGNRLWSDKYLKF